MGMTRGVRIFGDLPRTGTCEGVNEPIREARQVSGTKGRGTGASNRACIWVVAGRDPVPALPRATLAARLPLGGGWRPVREELLCQQVEAPYPGHADEDVHDPRRGLDLAEAKPEDRRNQVLVEQANQSPVDRTRHHENDGYGIDVPHCSPPQCNPAVTVCGATVKMV